ncbi:type 4a pilus biogenesis protein PilO [Desulfonauticus submarinus]
MEKIKKAIQDFFALPEKKRFIVYGVVIVLIITVWGYFGLWASLEEQSRLSRNLKSLDKEIARYRVIASKLKAVRKDLKFYERQFVLAKTLLPEGTKALEKLLASFEMKGREKGIEFVYFHPLNEVKFDFYAARRVNIRITGSFHNIVSYLDELTRLNRLVSIENIKFAPRGKQTTVSNLLVDCNLRVYRALTEKEILAQQETKKKKRRR